jgi:hypothetical protein
MGRYRTIGGTIARWGARVREFVEPPNMGVDELTGYRYLVQRGRLKVSSCSVEQEVLG